MAAHTNNSGYSNSGEDEVATPYNRPRPQFEMTRSAPAPVDPTAGLLAEGGFLTLNDRDRAGLNKWFHKSYQNIFAPLRERLNANFDTVFGALRKHDEEVVKLRAENSTLRSENATLKKEVHDWVNKKDVEFSREVLKLRNDNNSLRNDIQKDCALQTETVVDMMTDRVRRELAGEILKIQNEITEVRRGIDVTKIVADAARFTEVSFEGLRRELATEIAKSREESRREVRKAGSRVRASKKTNPEDYTTEGDFVADCVIDLMANHGHDRGRAEKTCRTTWAERDHGHPTAAAAAAAKAKAKAKGKK